MASSAWKGATFRITDFIFLQNSIMEILFASCNRQLCCHRVKEGEGHLCSQNRTDRIN
jgi:hypothetical protein